MFHGALRELDTSGENRKTSGELIDVQVLTYKLDVEVGQCTMVGSTGFRTREAVAGLESVLPKAEEPENLDLLPLQGCANVDCDMLHGAVQDLTRLQSLLDTAQQNHLNLEQTLSNLRAPVTNYSFSGRAENRISNLMYV